MRSWIKSYVSNFFRPYNIIRIKSVILPLRKVSVVLKTSSLTETFLAWIMHLHLKYSWTWRLHCTLLNEFILFFTDTDSVTRQTLEVCFQFSVKVSWNIDGHCSRTRKVSLCVEIWMCISAMQIKFHSKLCEFSGILLS